MTSRRRTSLVFLVLGLVVGALLYWRAATHSGKGAETKGATTPSARGAPVAKRLSGARGAPNTATRARSGTPIRLVPAVAGPDPDSDAGAFQGRVVNWGTGLGVPNAEIVFSGEQGATTTTSAADGGFVFRPAAAGAYRLAVASADGFLPFAPSWGRSPIRLVARAGLRVKGLVIYLTPAVAYAGRVLDPAGAPVAGARIKLQAAGRDERALVSIKDTFRSGADGTFSFSAPDFSELVATHPDHHPGRAILDGPAQISRKLDIKLSEVAPEAPVSLAGRVLDPDGAGVAGAVVRTGRAGHRNTRGYRTLSGPDGAYRFERVEPGWYRVTATSDDRAPASRRARAGDMKVDLTMRPSASIAGRVADDAGAPVAAFTVVVVERLGPMRERVIKSSSVFDAEGRFEVSNLQAGRYAVRAVAYGYPPAAAVDTTAVVAPAQPAAVTITMQRGGTLRGRVVDAQSKAPLIRAKVTVEGSVGSGPSALPLQSVAVTDEQGAFELAGLPVGRASVIAAAADHHSRIAGGLVVTPGAVLGPIEIALTPVKDGERPGLELAGIGAALAARDDVLVIQRVFEGSGAEGAGLKVGDAITAVEGRPVTAMGFQGTIQAIRGPVGTMVTLTIRRADGTLLNVVATRLKIRA